jgi:hypothetical protein
MAAGPAVAADPEPAAARASCQVATGRRRGSWVCPATADSGCGAGIFLAHSAWLIFVSVKRESAADFRLVEAFRCGSVGVLLSGMRLLPGDDGIRDGLIIWPSKPSVNTLNFFDRIREQIVMVKSDDAAFIMHLEIHHAAHRHLPEIDLNRCDVFHLGFCDIRSVHDFDQPRDRWQNLYGIPMGPYKLRIGVYFFEAINHEGMSWPFQTPTLRRATPLEQFQGALVITIGKSEISGGIIEPREKARTMSV